ncbi:MAG TPA: aldo/keto reductase [Stellaceae bacterium]|nr:aldo/keto reductase [Stellaceae bacterium]
MTLGDKIALNNGISIPRLGLGVCQLGRGRATENAVSWALEVGYRHVDTAAMHGNESEVGTALKRAFATGLVRREEIFVTTKLWNNDHGYDEALRAFDASHRRLGLDQIDLFLLHWPVPDRRLHAWRALERILAEGRCRAIGVSNFMVRHLEEILRHAHVPPAVNQIELHPWCQQRDVVAFCDAHDIAVAAYSPLTKGVKLGDSRLTRLAREVRRTPAQVLLRWSLQKGFVTIPKSAKKERIIENAAIFDFSLAVEEMAKLDSFNTEHHVTWDPRSEP